MFLQDPLLIPCFREKTLYHLHKLCMKKDDQNIETFEVFIFSNQKR